ncbi:unnamed protein product [Nezara viridula]|uniref:Uncharacterized protein n=1 Tax=Nezara viridula TaxID=85310 RepID=A0A9P0ECV4_NEZVI|nr:unnamed protein product [Nezara viridula]
MIAQRVPVVPGPTGPQEMSAQTELGKGLPLPPLISDTLPNKSPAFIQPIASFKGPRRIPLQLTRPGQLSSGFKRLS